MHAAIEYCIGHNILRDFLKEHQAEVLGMLLEEFDKEKYERTIRKESREEIIRKLYSKGLSSEKIAELTDLSVEQIERMLQNKESV